MTDRYSSADVVTVIRLVPLGRDTNSGIVTAVRHASMRRDGDALYLVTRGEPALRNLKVGDVVHGVVERFGVAWLAEQQTDASGQGH